MTSNDLNSNDSHEEGVLAQSGKMGWKKPTLVRLGNLREFIQTGPLKSPPGADGSGGFNPEAERLPGGGGP
jgi:hypothetical protein